MDFLIDPCNPFSATIHAIFLILTSLERTSHSACHGWYLEWYHEAASKDCFRLHWLSMSSGIVNRQKCRRDFLVLEEGQLYNHITSLFFAEYNGHEAYEKTDFHLSCKCQFWSDIDYFSGWNKWKIVHNQLLIMWISIPCFLYYFGVKCLHSPAF